MRHVVILIVGILVVIIVVLGFVFLSLAIRFVEESIKGVISFGRLGEFASDIFADEFVHVDLADEQVGKGDAEGEFFGGDLRVF